MKTLKVWIKFEILMSAAVCTASRQPHGLEACTARVGDLAIYWKNAKAVFDILWHSEDRASWYIHMIEANKMRYFSTLFWYTTPHVLEILVIIRSLHTAFTATADSQLKQYDKYQLLWIQYRDSWRWTVSLSRTCRVIYRNKLEK